MGGSFTVNFTGADRIIRETAKRDQFVRRMAQTVKAESILAMQRSPATGRVNPKTGHIASSPGNAPRIETSTLVNSIDVQRVADMRHAVGTAVLHGRDTEFGIGMLPRPWLRPAMMLVQGQIGDEAQRFFDSGIVF